MGMLMGEGTSIWRVQKWIVWTNHYLGIGERMTLRTMRVIYLMIFQLKNAIKNISTGRYSFLKKLHSGHSGWFSKLELGVSDSAILMVSELDLEAEEGYLEDIEDALRQLWRLSYPDQELPSLKSELWKHMGWQGTDPSTDFR